MTDGPLRLLRGPADRATVDGDVRVLSDGPISDLTADYFGFADFATALAEIVDNDIIDTPLTIVVSAPWGAGKTSVAGMMQTLLRKWVAEREGERPRLVCWFDAWEHSDAPHLGAALAAKVARTASSHRAWWRRALTPLPASMLGPEERWRRSLGLLATTLGAAVALTLIHSTRHASEKALHLDSASGIGWLALLLVVFFVWRRAFAAAKDAARFVDDPRSQAATGSMTQVKKQLGGLISQASNDGRLVIFIDDLERCPASRAVEVFEVASQLLAHPGVITVLLADMHALATSAQSAYTGEVAARDTEIGRRYLEKLVQLELELPPPSPTHMKRLLRGDPPPERPAETPASNLRSRARETVSLDRLMVWTQVGATLGLVFAGFYYLTSGAGGGFTSVAGASSAAGLASGALAWVIYRIQRGRQERRRDVQEKLREAFQELPDPGLAQVEADDPDWREMIATEALAAYASKEAESLLTVESQEVIEVERFIQRYPPPLPRGAKRMVNHARLLTTIARERGMFGGAPKLTPSHLGKWIVLRERWPRLADYVAESPQSMRGFESIARKAGQDATEAYESLVSQSTELIELLRKQPALGGVIERLIYFEPATDTKSKTATGSPRRPSGK